MGKHYMPLSDDVYMGIEVSDEDIKPTVLYETNTSKMPRGFTFERTDIK